MELNQLFQLKRESMERMILYIISHSMEGKFLTIVHDIIYYTHMYIHTAGMCTYKFNYSVLSWGLDMMLFSCACGSAV